MKLLKIYKNVEEVLKDVELVRECKSWIHFELRHFENERIYLLESECEELYFCRLNEETNKLEIYDENEEIWITIIK